MRLFFAITLTFASLLVLSEQQTTYTFEFQRVGDTITLICIDDSSRQRLQVSSDNSVRFWVNRTEGTRPNDNFESDLEERNDVRLIKGANDASFLLTPDLEGYFSCGIKSMNGPVVESPAKRLTCKRSPTSAVYAYTD